MGWSIGFDPAWNRDIGYGVPAICDQPECSKEIDRGLSYVCGGEPYGGELGCGLYFCGNHLWLGLNDYDPQLCVRCCDGEQPFDPTSDTQEWIIHKLTDESWGKWRSENPEWVIDNLRYIK